MNKNIILFDFDGVILDSFRTAFAVNKIVCPDISEEHYRQFFEGNIFEEKESGDIHSERCRHDDFWAHYIPRLKREGTLVPGMGTVVKELSQGNTLIVVSSGMTDFIEAFLDSQSLLSSFARVMGNDVHKSKEEKIRMVFSEYGDASASDCVFITDTLGDIREAERTEI